MFSQMLKRSGIALLCLCAGSLGANVYAASVSATASITDINTTLLSLSNNQYLSDASTPFQSGFNASSVLQIYFFNTTASNGDSSFAQIDDTFALLLQMTAGAVNRGFGSASVL